MSRIIEFLKAFNSRTCQVVLGAGAMRSAGLKNITAKHLALASQSLSIVIALIPYIRETFRRHLSPKQAVMLVEFDKLKRDYQEHQNEIHAKLIAIMGDRITAHIKSFNAIRWDVPQAKPGVNDYMELLVKETVTLHKVLSRYLAKAVVEVRKHIDPAPMPLTDSIVQYVMSEVFATINHRLSEEYTKIELPTSDAKERCVHSHYYLRPQMRRLLIFAFFFPNHRLLTDAHYLHEKFSVLKAPGTPTAVLETLVADKRVATAPVSPRPTTPTPMTTPSSPLSLPPTNIPLGSPRSAVQPPTKRTSLFSNERLKGMLSRGTTQPQPQPPPPPISIPETTSSPPPTLTQEKQGGYKHVAVLLSPTPLPAEKQRDLPTTPTSVPIHATPSPLLSQVEEERPEPAAYAPNVDAVDIGADESGRRPGRMDGETDGGVLQGNGNVVAEKAPPPPPAKDADVASVSAS